MQILVNPLTTNDDYSRHRNSAACYQLAQSVLKIGSASLVPRPRAPPGEKRSGERSRISWAYYPKRVMTNEIARLVR